MTAAAWFGWREQDAEGATVCCWVAALQPDGATRGGWLTDLPVHELQGRALVHAEVVLRDGRRLAAPLLRLDLASAATVRGELAAGVPPPTWSSARLELTCRQP